MRYTYWKSLGKILINNPNTTYSYSSNIQNDIHTLINWKETKQYPSLAEFKWSGRVVERAVTRFWSGSASVSGSQSSCWKIGSHAVW